MAVLSPCGLSKAEPLARIRYTCVSSAAPHPETVHRKSAAQAHTVPLRIRVTMRSFYFFIFALAATVSGWGAVLCADQARDLASSGSMARAAERYAVPLVGMAALSAACLGCAAGAATDRRS